MIVSNNLIISEIFNGSSKVINNHSYLVRVTWREETHIFLVKREGQRSWGAFALTDIEDEYCHIKGNSSTILENVLNLNIRGNWRVWKISNTDKTHLRKCVMEVLTYGTVGDTAFEINKYN